MSARFPGFGPAMPRPPVAEVLKAALGAGFGLIVTAIVLGLLSPNSGDPRMVPLLIAPFGASAFLIFVVPNSPLAQPWSVVVGNTLSAMAALIILLLPIATGHAAALAVIGAVIAMALARALHPPGGAVALYAVLAHPADWTFIATPVLAGSVALVVAGAMWNHVTGRKYPFRQAAPALHGTKDQPPARRHLPPPGALADLLAQLRLGANIGVEDLSRLINAVETEAAAQPLAGLTAAHLMSRDLVTVAPQTPLTDLAHSFLSHRFKTLPVVADGVYQGLVQDSALLDRAPASRAADLMDTAPETVAPTTVAAHLVQLLADGRQQAIPVVQNGQLLGLVTRSDLISLLARSFAP